MLLFDNIIREVYLPIFHQQGEAAIKSFCNCKVPMELFLSAYNKLAPMPQDEVEELFNYATELYPDETEHFRTNVAKLTYTLAQYLN